MREQLVKYIDLLFAGARDAEDIKQEILQNTLDRYDDLIAQGKAPESAYSLAISGIGDISEILRGRGSAAEPKAPAVPVVAEKKDSRNARLCRAAAIMFFILCPIPVILIENVLGVCLLLAMVAAGVGLLVLFGKEEQKKEQDSRSPAHRILHGIAWGSGLALYFWLSFSTGAWYITWLMFPIIGAMCGFISAFFDLNKTFLNAVVRIVLFGLLTLVLATVLFGFTFAVNIFDFVQESYTQQEDHLGTQETLSGSSGTVSADRIKNLKIQWVSGSITVRTGEVENIQFEETGNFLSKEKMIWKQNGDTLTIQFSKPTRKLIGVNNTASKDLTVTVPRDWTASELEIDSVSARIQVSELSAKEMKLVNISGRCDFTGCDFGEFSSETVSGEVCFEGTLRELDFDTVSADCTAVLSGILREVDLDAVSGDLILVLPEDCGFTLELDTLSGEFSSEYSATTSGKSYFYGTGSCEISADTVSGDVKIQKP